MKYPIIFLFSLLPTFLTSNQTTVEPINVPVDVHEEFASLDDVLNTLDGSVTFDEDTNTYTYRIQNKEIQLNLDHGYSQVNGENEALFIETDEETNLMTIKWVTPQLIDDEIYVPIQYIERVLNATYTDHAFTIQVTETVIEEEDEELISESNPEDIKEPTKVSNTSTINQVEQTPNQTINKTNQIEQTPNQTTTKPKPVEPTPPVQVEEEPPTQAPEQNPEDQPTPPINEDKDEPIEPQPPVDDSPIPPSNSTDEEDEEEAEQLTDDSPLSEQIAQSEDMNN